MSNKPGGNNPNMAFRDARHPAAKFDDATVRRIRRRVQQPDITYRAIAESLNCHPNTIANMVVRKTYGGVE